MSLTRDIQGPELRLFAMAAYPALYSVSTTFPDSQIRLGAQDVYWEDHGPFTGAVSPPMLKECGVQVVQIGHSERRQYFGESDATVNKKVQACLRHGLDVLVCVGETADDKASGISVERIREQTKIALQGTQPRDWERIWIAYEPAWAIGPKGIPASAEYASEMHRALREVLVQISPTKGKQLPLLYGGSVDAANSVEYISCQEIDGLYVGRAAYDPQSFNGLIRNVRRAWLKKDEVQ